MPFIGKLPDVGAFRLIDSITTSATDTYALQVEGLSYFPSSARNLIVSLNGVTQAPESAYTVSGSNIIFDSALTASDVIDYILVIGESVDIGTPSDNTVGNAQLKSDLDFSGKTLTFSADQISGDAINGGTISSFASTGIDDNATSTAITIDSSQNVGINTASPDGKLNVFSASAGSVSADADADELVLENSGNVGLSLLTAATGESGIYFGNPGTNGQKDFYLKYYHESHATTANRRAFTFNTRSAERMRIDASGNLLVGKTSPATNVEGGELRENGQVLAVATDINPFFGARLGSDGDLAVFRKDSTTVGSIGVASSELYVSSGNTGLYFDDVNNLIRPTNSAGALRDNIVDLGASNSRFDDIYATNGTIQTSDVNEKQDIEALSEAEQRVAVAAKGLLRKFRWKSAVEEKGDDARVHFGIIAQDLQAAFEAEGLDAGDYGMFIHSTWTDEETGEERSRMGVRYSELLAFIIAAI